MIADGVSEAAIDYLPGSMALPRDKYKAAMERDRGAGNIAH